MLKKFFAPGSDTLGISLGLLTLRVWLGLTMHLAHGHDKLMHFHEKAASFSDPLHVGHTTSLALTVFAEFFASMLLALGLLTRFAALVLTINFGVIYFVVFKHQFTDHSELPFIFLAGFLTLLLTGGGRFSVDKVLFGKTAKAKTPAPE